MNLIERDLIKVGDSVWCDMIGNAIISNISKTEILIAAKDRPNNFFVALNPDGSYFDSCSICVIWPSKDERSWDNIIPDKALVEAWDDGELFRTIGFYNEERKSLCGLDHTWDNYKIIPKKEWPAWAHEVIKKLNNEVS